MTVLPFFYISAVQDCSLPAGSLRTKKVAKSPGYMRAEVVQQVEFLSHPECETCSSTGLEHQSRTHYRPSKNCAQLKQYKPELKSFHSDTSVNRVPGSLNMATGSQTVRNTAEGFGPLSDLGILQSDNLIVPANPAIVVQKGDILPGYTSYSQQTNLLDAVEKTAYSSGPEKTDRMYAMGLQEVNNNQESENKDTVYNFSSVQDHFNSHFSFIQLSLSSASETSDVRPPSNCSEKKEFMQTGGVEKAENVNLHVPGEGRRTLRTELWASSNSTSGKDCKCPQESAEDDQLQDCERLSLLHASVSCCCSTDSLDAASAVSSVTSGYESSNTAGDHSWDSLMKTYEPALQESLQANRSVVKVGGVLMLIWVRGRKC